MSNNGWIGVDLDGTLAEYHGWKGTNIGDPIPLMVDRVKKWLKEGKDVRIVTARVWKGVPTWVDHHFVINEWCIRHLGQSLPITNEKDFEMLELWDDRAIQVIPNTGLRVDGEQNGVTVYGN